MHALRNLREMTLAPELDERKTFAAVVAEGVSLLAQLGVFVVIAAAGGPPVYAFAAVGAKAYGGIGTAVVHIRTAIDDFHLSIVARRAPRSLDSFCLVQSCSIWREIV